MFPGFCGEQKSGGTESGSQQREAFVVANRPPHWSVHSVNGGRHGLAQDVFALGGFSWRPVIFLEAFPPLFAVPVLPRFCVSICGLGAWDYSRWVASQQAGQEAYALQISCAWAQIRLLSVKSVSVFCCCHVVRSVPCGSGPRRNFSAKQKNVLSSLSAVDPPRVVPAAQATKRHAKSRQHRHCEDDQR